MLLVQITLTRKDFVKILWYYDLYVQSDTLILADVSKNFQNMSVEIYECNPFHFLSAELAWQAALKKAKKNKFINWHWYVTNGTKRY